jgi:hypothetical protein
MNPTINKGMDMEICLFAALNTPKLVRPIEIVQCPDLAEFIAPATVESPVFNRSLQQGVQHDQLVGREKASPFLIGAYRGKAQELQDLPPGSSRAKIQ